MTTFSSAWAESEATAPTPSAHWGRVNKVRRLLDRLMADGDDIVPRVLALPLEQRDVLCRALGIRPASDLTWRLLAEQHEGRVAAAARRRGA